MRQSRGLYPIISGRLATAKMNNANPELRELVGHSFSGYYETCIKIELSFISPSVVVADLISTDFVGSGSWGSNGTLYIPRPGCPD